MIHSLRALSLSLKLFCLYGVCRQGINMYLGRSTLPTQQHHVDVQIDSYDHTQYLFFSLVTRSLLLHVGPF